MFNKLRPVDGYSYYISNDSDEEGGCDSDSSDEVQQLDEVNVFLHGTPDQKRHALQRLTGDDVSSSEDEFEKTMRQELNKTMETLEKSWIPHSGNNEPTTSKGIASHKDETYDDIYFDSDEDDENVQRKKKKLSNDELFYDPLADDLDQKWIDKQRSRGSGKLKKSPRKSSSDAMLSCPACLTTLCIDCQRHDVYQNQFRAMFVVNCHVQTDEVLRYKEPKKKKFKRHKQQQNAESASDAGYCAATTSEMNSTENIYNPVKCSTCSTEVAVYDCDEVFHFFNVIAGHA